MNERRVYGRINIERLSLAYAKDRNTLKIGRQAITWGNGKLLNPFDRFDPFSPLELDPSYKPGADMFYYQRLFDSGADMQFIYLPRKSVTNNQVRQDISSFAAKYLFYQKDWEFELLAAQDWDDTVAGASVVGSLGKGLWATDLVYVGTTSGKRELSMSTNIQYAGTWASKPVTVFAEYARNDFGFPGKESFAKTSPELRAQFLRDATWHQPSFTRPIIACLVSILSSFGFPHDSGKASLKVETFKSLLGDVLNEL